MSFSEFYQRSINEPEQFWAEQECQAEQYESGTWGPRTSDDMMARDGRVWRMP